MEFVESNKIAPHLATVRNYVLQNLTIIIENDIISSKN